VPSKRPIFKSGECASVPAIEHNAREWELFANSTGTQFPRGLEQRSPLVLDPSRDIFGVRPPINCKIQFIFRSSLKLSKDRRISRFSVPAASAPGLRSEGEPHSNDRGERVSKRFLAGVVQIVLGDISLVNGASI
jgi:hypothetical protein